VQRQLGLKYSSQVVERHPPSSWSNARAVKQNRPLAVAFECGSWVVPFQASLGLLNRAGAAPRKRSAIHRSTKHSDEVVAVTALVGSGGLAVPPIAQDQSRTFQLCFDPNPFNVALEADGLALQIVFDLEHLADLHQQLVVREPVAHLVGG
jgi:hypothetical protein